MMKYLCCVLLVFISLVVKAEQVAVPAFKQDVIDTTQTLSVNEKNALAQALQALQNSTGHQIAILMVTTTGDDTIEQYATRVFNQWKLGAKDRDDGVLLLVAKQDRRLRIEVGYGLEGTITDLQADQIISQNITPWFKKDDYAKGLESGVLGIAQIVSPSLALSFSSPLSSSPELSPSPKLKYEDVIDGAYKPYAIVGFILAIIIFRLSIYDPFRKILNLIFAIIAVTIWTTYVPYFFGMSINFTKSSAMVFAIFITFFCVFVMTKIVLWIGRGGRGGSNGRSSRGGGGRRGGGRSGGGGSSGGW